jgi:hypothetical protein
MDAKPQPRAASLAIEWPGSVSPTRFAAQQQAELAAIVERLERLRRAGGPVNAGS